MPNLTGPDQPQNNPADLAPLHIIRTETVLSKLPIHNLAKTGSFEIQITRKNDRGEIDLRWEVSHSSRYGPPRQLAYKVDTIVVNRRIDESGRPVPRVIRLGSLRDIARELDLGGDTNNVRKALRQNAFTAIAAKLTYRSSDGTERKIEADFTRYSVIFAGETLPDGRQADCVHLVFNEPYLEVLNSAPVRPLNYDYLKQLPPAAQRFYEIVSYKMFAALKYNQPVARLTYSDFCTFSAMQRYHDYDHFKKQMYKIHRHHLLSGYLTKVRYEEALDGAGQPDWTMLYEPGPKARAEFATFERKRAPLLYSDPEPAPEPEAPTRAAVPPPGEGNSLLGELTRRGVSEKQARKLLEDAGPDQPVLEQLAWGDRLISQSRQRIYNPPGFYIYLIRERVLPPSTFESPGRQEAQQRLPLAPVPAAAEPGQRLAYEEYKRMEIDHFIAVHYTGERYAELIAEKSQEIRKQYKSATFWSADNLREVAEGAVRAEVSARIQFVSFDNFRGRNEGPAENIATVE